MSSAVAMSRLSSAQSYSPAATRSDTEFPAPAAAPALEHPASPAPPTRESSHESPTTPAAEYSSPDPSIADLEAQSPPPSIPVHLRVTTFLTTFHKNHKFALQVAGGCFALALFTLEVWGRVESLTHEG